MTWNAETSNGFESDKIAHLVVPYTRGRCLDIGCGSRKCWPHMIGYDQTPSEAVNVLGKADDLSMFADEAFDSVFSSHCLEDLEDTAAVLAEWWRIVKPGGYLVLYLPHKDLYPNVGQEGANPAHRHDFQPRDILDHMVAICGTGFDLIENQVRDRDNEYSFFQVYRKRTDGRIHWTALWQRNPEGKKRCLVVRFGAIGDMIMASSVLPGLKEQGWHVTMCTTPAGEEVVRHNPFIDEFLIQDKDQVPNRQLNAYFEALGERYDRIVNLSESIEGSLLFIPGRAAHWMDLPARRRVVGDINYLERTHDIAGVPYKFDARFYGTNPEREWASAYRETLPGPVVYWVLGGTSNHKIYPFAYVVIAWLLQKTDATIVLCGGPGEKMLQAGVMACLAKDDIEGLDRIRPMVGEWSVRAALAFAEVADVVVGPETGVLNAIGLSHIPKVVMLSHSSHENLTKHWNKTIVLSPKDCPCHPCHALHYTWDHCHQVEETAAALCASNIAPELVYKAIAYALDIEGCRAVA